MQMRAAIAAIVVFSIASTCRAGDSDFGYVYGEILTPGRSPIDIVAGPDGAMWFTNSLGQAIGRVRDSGDNMPEFFPLQTVEPLDAPERITLGPDGNFWFTDFFASAVGRMTPLGENEGFALPANSGPIDIAPGPDGNVWVTGVIFGPRGVSPGFVGRVTPNGTVSTFPLAELGSGIASGIDGALWITNFSRLARVTTNGNAQYFPVDPGLLDITSGPDGALWFTRACSGVDPLARVAGLPLPCEYGVGRFTTDGELTRFFNVDGDVPVLSIVRGPEDNLWFSRADGRISRLNLAGRVDDLYIVSTGYATNLAMGPDGGVWFTQVPADRIGYVSTLAYDFLRLTNGGPAGLAQAPNGDVWFTDAGGDRVGRLPAGGGLVQYELGPGREPLAIAPAPDGGAYFTNFQTGTIGRVTADEEVVEYALPFPDDLPDDIVLGPDGNYWFTASVNSVGRITPAGSVDIFPAPSEDSGPRGITAGPDGNIWFTEAIANRIARMNTDGDAVDFPIPTEDSEPWDIVAAPDGFLYFTQRSSGGLARIDVNGEVTELGTLAEPGEPTEIGLGPDGAVWFSIVPVLQRSATGSMWAPRPRGVEDPPGPARLGRMAADGRITTFDIPVSGEGSPGGIAGNGVDRLFVALGDSARIASIELVAAQPTPTVTETPEFPDPTPTPTDEEGAATATPTEEGGGPTATPTDEGGGPTATPTEEGGEPTHTETPGGVCAGDCDGNATVSIAELISVVNVALGNASVDSCTAGDVNHDGAVLINELIAAVTRALAGC